MRPLAVHYLFAFETEDAARTFVQRLAHYLKDIAIFRAGSEVKVLDGSLMGQREEILRLARSSSANRVLIGDLEKTVF